MHYVLPISKKIIAMRLPSGSEDVLLCEWRGDETALTHVLLNAIADNNSGQDACDWGGLTITDIEWALLQLRSALFGDWVKTAVVCNQADCTAKVDISFRISEYLGQFRIGMPAAVERSPQSGWFSLPEKSIQFRLPTGNDRCAVAFAPQPGRELMKRCASPDELSDDALEQLEECLETMAPVISGILRGDCPECGAAGDYYFDVQIYVLNELIEQAKFVFEDVHLLASHYRWPEDAILNLPRQRRFRYAEAIIRDRSVI